jgi:hypothetical protein
MVLLATIRICHNSTISQRETQEIRNRYLLVVQVRKETNERLPFQGMLEVEDRDQRPLQDSRKRG